MLASTNLPSVLAGVKLRRLERTNQMPPKPDAVLVDFVVRGSAASLRGLRAGDIILAVNRKPVYCEDDLVRAAQIAGRVLALEIMRDEGRIVILVQ